MIDPKPAAPRRQGMQKMRDFLTFGVRWPFLVAAWLAGAALLAVWL